MIGTSRITEGTNLNLTSTIAVHYTTKFSLIECLQSFLTLIGYWKFCPSIHKPFASVQNSSGYGLVNKFFGGQSARKFLQAVNKRKSGGCLYSIVNCALCTTTTVWLTYFASSCPQQFGGAALRLAEVETYFIIQLGICSNGEVHGKGIEFSILATLSSATIQNKGLRLLTSHSKSM